MKLYFKTYLKFRKHETKSINTWAGWFKFGKCSSAKTFNRRKNKYTGYPSLQLIKIFMQLIVQKLSFFTLINKKNS